MTKDPYNFDFIAIRQGYNEKELKDALMDNVQNFLMELGTGFAFVGREYRLQVGDTEQYIDMLFYNTKRHCYVVVEVKVVEFEPGFYFADSNICVSSKSYFERQKKIHRQ